MIVSQDFAYTDMEGNETVFEANFEDALAEASEMPSAYTLDGMLTQEEVDAFFVAE